MYFITKTRSTLLSLREKCFDCDVKVTYMSQNSSFTIVPYAGTETSHANPVDRKIWKHLLPYSNVFHNHSLLKRCQFCCCCCCRCCCCCCCCCCCFDECLSFASGVLGEHGSEDGFCSSSWSSSRVKYSFIPFKGKRGCHAWLKKSKKIYTYKKKSQFKGNLLQQLNFSCA